MTKFHRRITVLLSLCVACALGIGGILLPLSAQDSTFATNTPVRGFATNTPEGSQSLVTPRVIATNTPIPQPTPLGPAAGFSNYALRLWLERDMLGVLYDQVARISVDSLDSQRAVQLLQYELEFRFPGAPRNMDDRATLVDAMINAPLGTVDMQAVVRPYIENAINNNLVQDGQFNGFQLEIMPANLDAGNVDDAIIHIVYPDPLIDATRYEDYVLALGNTDGGYRFVPLGYNAPIVPYDGVESITMDRLDDVNDDGVDELALIVNDGDLNKRLYILGYRGGEAVDLTRSGETLRFGEIIEWQAGGAIVTNLYQLADTRWNCISELTVTWSYTGNFYRSSVPTDSSFRNQDTFGCDMSEAEPLFAMRPASATQLITDSLVEYGSQVNRADRAVMTLAMLYALDGQVDLANETAVAAQGIGDINSWVSQQSELFLQMLNEPNNTAFDICVALAEANHGEVGACDVRALLGRVFNEAVFPDVEPIAIQLERIGLDVVQSQVISEVGRADRTAVDFGIESAGWWAFVANEGVYTATPIDTPAGFELPESSPELITVPQTVYAELLVDSDPSGVLNIIETTRVANPNIPFSEAFQFIEALSNDLLANREVARRTYYDLWEAYPESIWGQLAGKHLELS